LTPAAPGDVLTLTRKWVLTALLPATNSNQGLEGLKFIPNGYLQTTFSRNPKI
jgi:hypothetical protein